MFTFMTLPFAMDVYIVHLVYDGPWMGSWRKVDTYQDLPSLSTIVTVLLSRCGHNAIFHLHYLPISIITRSKCNASH